MTRAHNVILSAIAAIAFTASATLGQVIKQVPDNAVVVLKVANLEVTSKKIADFCGPLGLIQMRPELADPLTWFLKDRLQATAGVNRSGELAIVMLDPAVVAGNFDHALFGLLPVSDYQAFLGNYPDAKTVGDLTEVHLHGEAVPTYIAHWGDYAAISDAKQPLELKPTAFLELHGLSAKEMDNKDIVIYANLTRIRGKALAEIEKGRTSMVRDLDEMSKNTATTRQAEAAKFVPLLKIAGNEALDGCKRVLLDTNGATFGLNISPDGISTTSMIEFQPSSYTATLAAGVKNTDATMLAGLPDGKYLGYGGLVMDPKQITDYVTQVTAPLEKPLADLGPAYVSLHTLLDQVKLACAAQTGATVGWLAPSGALGQEAMLQAIYIRNGDAKVLFDTSHTLVQGQQDAMKVFGLDETNGASTTTITPNAKTIDAISFDEFQTTMSMNGPNPMQQQMTQMMAFLYGPNGMTAYIGIVNAKSLLMISGVSDPITTAAITAIKTSDDPLGRQSIVKAVAEQLPARRAMVMYIPLDIWATTGLNYARMFSMDYGVRIPDDLPPMGVALSTQESAVRVDSFLPAQLIQNLVSAGMQIYVASHQPASQPSAPGGGL